MNTTASFTGRHRRPRPSLSIVTAERPPELRPLLERLGALGLHVEVVHPLSFYPLTAAHPVYLRVGGSGHGLLRAMEIAHLLPLEGGSRPVVNAPSALQIAHSQLLTAGAFRAVGVPHPVTLPCFTAQGARLAAERLGYPLVARPTLGTDGGASRLMTDETGLEDAIEALVELPAGFVVQPAVREPRDLYVLVVDGGIAGAVMAAEGPPEGREQLGRIYVPTPADAALERLALDAAAAIGTDVATVHVLAREEERIVADVHAVPRLARFARHPDALDTLAHALADRCAVPAVAPRRRQAVALSR